ncbi:MAG: peptide chain release factor N(5)-glutamine methyltransferase [Clostridia bacterium]|nr:peptide chain release factor N(5)-glutamine methyltransferase [Clostridia bacterium]
MKEKQQCVSIGGQALIEGVMMQSRTTQAMAVRNPDGFVEVKVKKLKSMGIWAKIPIIRGCISFVKSLISGTKTVYESAEVAFPEEDTPGSFAMGISGVIGMLFAIALFFVLPSLAVSGIEALFKITIDKYIIPLIEGAIRILIFVIYLLLVSKMKDIRRTFMYHGAEHRTINCFEKGMDLTVENVQKCSTRHNRCGTTFLFFVMIMSILVIALTTLIFSLCGIGWLMTEGWTRIVIRLGLLPIIAGCSYELLQGLARLPDNWFVDIFRAPGLALQRLTTYPPEDDMAEVAILSFNTVRAYDANPDKPLISFGQYEVSAMRNFINSKLSATDADSAEADWIMCHVLKIKRAELALRAPLNKDEYKAVMEIVNKRKEGTPLDYILGESEFYGLKIKVNENVLIPRLDTEVLVEHALKYVRSGDKVLDLMTGSGCIAKAIKNNSTAQVFASDVSDEAIEVAKSNLSDDGVLVIKSDVLENVDDVFDVIVSNPPYIRTEVVDTLTKEVLAQPRIALDGGADGLDVYRKIALQVPDHLTDEGTLALEIGYDQAKDVADIMMEKFSFVRIIKDLNGNDRVVIAKNKKVK